jgi:hypothetical protein
MHHVTSVTFNIVRVYTFTICSTSTSRLKIRVWKNISVLSSQSGDTQWRSWLRHYATSWKVPGSIPKKVTGFFNWPNPSSHTMALVSTQPLPEMSTRNLPGGKGKPAHKDGNSTATSEQTVYKIWEPLRLTTLWASTACYRDRVTLVVNLT